MFNFKHELCFLYFLFATIMKCSLRLFIFVSFVYFWWINGSVKAPPLQKISIQVSSHTSSASGCECNWSLFQKIHTKKHVRLRLLNYNMLELNIIIIIIYDLKFLLIYQDLFPSQSHVCNSLNIGFMSTTIFENGKEAEKCPVWIPFPSETLTYGLSGRWSTRCLLQRRHLNDYRNNNNNRGRGRGG